MRSSRHSHARADAQVEYRHLLLGSNVGSETARQLIIVSM